MWSSRQVARLVESRRQPVQTDCLRGEEHTVSRFAESRLALSTLAALTALALISLPAPVSAVPVTASVTAAPSTAARPAVAVGVLVKPRPAAGLSVQAAMSDGPIPCAVPAGKTAEDYAAELRATGRFEYVEPDYVRTVDGYTSQPNDPDFTDASWWYFSGVGIGHAKSWYLRGAGSANFDSTWPFLATDGVAYHARVTAAQVPIAVIDTGFYLGHSDRGDIVGRKDCFQSYSNATGYVTGTDVTPDPVTAPLNSEGAAAHGTITASEIAQASDNGIGSTGAGYDAKIYVYKVQGIWVEGNPSGGYPAGCSVILDGAVVDAIRTAADDGCRVISMSLGGPSPSAAMQSAIDYAWSKGAVVVASAGNSGKSGLVYPGAANHVLGVGATFATSAGVPVRSSFSSYGTGLDIMAPGEGIWGSTRPGYDADGTGASNVPGYCWWSGTSMAAPLVAAAAGTLLRLVPGLSPDEVAGLLTASATDMGAAGYDTTTGWGLLNAQAAVARLTAAYPVLPPPRLSGLTAGATYPANPLPTLSWTPVAGYGVTYTVRGDWSATPLYSGPATSLSLTGIPDGMRQVSVVPTSTRNWSDASSVAIVGFAVNVCTITSTAGPNGSISPLGVQTVAVGGSRAFTITPASGYRIAGVMVDGSPVGAPNSYSFSNVAADHTISVTFATSACTLTYSAGTGGTISGTSPQSVSPGGSGTAVTAVANPGYHFMSWSDGVLTAARTDSSVTANKSVTASFAINTYTLTYAAGTGGTISGTTPQTVNSGASGTPVTAVPNTGYRFTGWSDGNTTNPRTDTNVTAHKSVGARFTLGTTPATAVYRFYNLRMGVHFYTASATEMTTVRDTLSRTYRLEGVAYSLNTGNSANNTSLYRFYNIKKGVHFYTASEVEKANVIAKLSGTYRYEGVAYKVCTTPVAGATPVYRFYNLKQGVHFYTASAVERDNVVRTLSSTYRLEGIGYYLAP
jgi:hypothetical protein